MGALGIGMRGWGRLGLYTAAMAGIAVASTAAFVGGTREEAAILGGVLLATGLAGVAAATAADASSRSWRLGTRVTVVTGVAMVIVVLNVLVASWLMFLSGHDLSLLVILLLYALAVTAGPALLMGAGLGRRLGTIEEAAARFGAGDLSARMAGAGEQDELGRVEAAFNEMADRLEDSDRKRREVEDARRELFVAVSHDLRTPLASIRAMVEALSDGVVADDSTRARYLESISNQVRRLSLLIDDVFELAKLDSGELRLQMERVRLEQVVQETVDALRPQADQAGVRLTFEGPPQGPPILADPERLTRVLYNLVQNALRHTPADGAVTLTTSVAGPRVRVAVCDTGEGIDAEDLPHVFERFYRGERSRSRETGGSGLGLAIARGIVEAHGGRIWAESPPQSGAVVTFELPVPGVRGSG